jgi:hypothetical protein
MPRAMSSDTPVRAAGCTVGPGLLADFADAAGWPVPGRGHAGTHRARNGHAHDKAP